MKVLNTSRKTKTVMISSFNLTDAVGRKITISGSTNPDFNGTFTIARITTLVDGQCVYTLAPDKS